MRKCPPCRYAASRGFTLVESIITLVVLGIAAAAIITLSGNIFNSDSGNKNLQVGMQLMQECAEHVLATRRVKGYSVTPSCGNLTGFAGGQPPVNFSAPTVTSITETTTGTFASGTPGCTAGGSCGCPPSGTCKLVTISVTTGVDTLTPITLLLVGGP